MFEEGEEEEEEEPHIVAQDKDESSLPSVSLVSSLVSTNTRV